MLKLKTLAKDQKLLAMVDIVHAEDAAAGTHKHAH